MRRRRRALSLSLALSLLLTPRLPLNRKVGMIEVQRLCCAVRYIMEEKNFEGELYDQK